MDDRRRWVLLLDSNVLRLRSLKAAFLTARQVEGTYSIESQGSLEEFDLTPEIGMAIVHQNDVQMLWEPLVARKRGNLTDIPVVFYTGQWSPDREIAASELWIHRSVTSQPDISTDQVNEIVDFAFALEPGAPMYPERDCRPPILGGLSARQAANRFLLALQVVYWQWEGGYLSDSEVAHVVRSFVSDSLGDVPGLQFPDAGGGVSTTKSHSGRPIAAPSNQALEDELDRSSLAYGLTDHILRTVTLLHDRRNQEQTLVKRFKLLDAYGLFAEMTRLKRLLFIEEGGNL